MDLTQLYEKFELRTRKGLGGKQFKYIPSADVIDRMNRVFMGRWTSEVIFTDVVEDQVVVRVKVTAYDYDDNNNLIHVFHEGFGSSAINRYNSGTNEGKIIDVGNSYKSAESMAIRNACTRFGVGLYVEDSGETSAPSTPGYKESGDIPQTVNTSVPSMPAPPQARPSSYNQLRSNPPAEPEPQKPTESAPASAETTHYAPTSNTPGTPSMPGMPKFPGASNSAPAPGPQSNRPAPPTPGPAATPPAPQGEQEPLATDVQKAALEGILSIQNADYETLVRDAFESNGLDASVIPSMDELTYKQAVLLVKHGNILFRKQ